jgi:DNA-binding response OmpR family regulator
MPTILIVDDEPTIRTLVRLTLEPHGYDVIEAAEGATALELVAFHHPDLVLLDVALPRLSGLEVARRLGDSTPVLLLTGLSSGEEFEAVVDTAVRGFVEKPFHPIELARRVQETLESVALAAF